MQVEVIVADLPYVGKLGAQREIPDGQARVLIALNKVKAVDGARTSRRVYQRRDMVAAGTSAPTPIDAPPDERSRVVVPGESTDPAATPRATARANKRPRRKGVEHTPRTAQ